MVQRGNGFTLVEVLVVMAVVAMLLGVLGPAVGRAKERGRRTVCANQVRQFIVAIHAYASENDGRLPSGLSDKGEDEHTPVLSRAMYEALTGESGDIRFLMCPWLRDPFTNPDSWYYQKYGDYGYLLGYNYLGGHGGTPWALMPPATREWMSPQTISDRGTLAAVTELNAWTTGEHVTFAPHGKRGPIHDYTSPWSGGIPPNEIGAEGGNVGLLDGSASWRDIGDMQVYSGSRHQSGHSCFTMW